MKTTRVRFVGLLLAMGLWFVGTPAMASERPNAVEANRGTPENTRAACSDHLDNDMDGHEDCDDQDCQDLAICVRTPQPPPPRADVAARSVARSPEYLQRRSRATMRIVAGSLLLSFGFLVAGASAGLWIAREGDPGNGKPYIAGGIVMDLAGAGMIAAGSTLLVLGAGDAAALRYAHAPTVGVAF